MKEHIVNPIGIGDRNIDTRSNKHAAILSSLLEIAMIDDAGERIGSRRRRQLVGRLPAALGGYAIDDFMDSDPTATRHQARQLLLSDAIESTSIIQEQVINTVTAGAEAFQIIRKVGAQWFTMQSNALRAPLGGSPYNAPAKAEGAEGEHRTQDYGKRDFSAETYMAIPDITDEMVHDGMIDTIASEIFYAGAACENRLNYEALTALATNAGSTTVGVGSATAGTGLKFVREAKKMIKTADTADAVGGFHADTIIMCSEFEDDLLANATLNTPYASLGEGVVKQGILPSPLLGLKWFTTDNGSATVDGSHPWGYAADDEVGAIVMSARAGCGIGMNWDITTKKFDDIVRGLKTMTVSIRFDVQYMHAKALAVIPYDEA